jgi:hypothetical protein
MSFDATVRSGLNTAWRILGDLKRTVVFQRKLATANYNFSAREITGTESENVTVEAVVLKDEKPAREKNTRKIQLLYKTEEVGDLSNYDNVEIDGSIWKIGSSPLSETGHVSYVEVFKEVTRG